MRTYLLIPMMVSAALTAAPAHAVVAPTAAASISNIGLLFTDLDPFDGRVPFATYSNVKSFVGVSSPNLTNSLNDRLIVTLTRRREEVVPLSVSFPTVPGFRSVANASLEGGLIGDMRTNMFVPDLNNLGATTSFSFDFQLSGMSSLTVTWRIDGSAAIPSVGLTATGQSAAAETDAQFRGPLVDQGSKRYYFNSTVTADSRTPSEVFGGDFSVTFTNLTTEFQPGSVAFDTAAGGVNSVLVVPEPEVYAMFLAGLGLLGFRRRIRGDFQN